jgi:hypothetical protein
MPLPLNFFNFSSDNYWVAQKKIQKKNSNYVFTLGKALGYRLYWNWAYAQLCLAQL